MLEAPAGPRRIPRLTSLRGRQWSAVERTVLISVLAIVPGRSSSRRTRLRWATLCRAAPYRRGSDRRARGARPDGRCGPGAREREPRARAVRLGPGRVAGDGPAAHLRDARP